jgi:DNA-binding GntR family transcriptional regulator
MCRTELTGVCLTIRESRLSNQLFSKLPRHGRHHPAVSDGRADAAERLMRQHIRTARVSVAERLQRGEFIARA